MPGKLVAVEGQDGTGKATQVKLLTERLKKESIAFQAISFPQYGQPSARMVEEYLKGGFGPTETIRPEIASVFYAQDRFATRRQIIEWQKSGNVVLADRYAASNCAHQGGKISDPHDRQEFFGFLEWLEFEFFGNVRPQLNIVLSIPPVISFEAAKQRAIKESRSQVRLGRSRDGHEIDFQHIKNAALVYRELTEIYPKEYKLVDCMENGRWLSPEAIHEKIWFLITPLL